MSNFPNLDRQIAQMDVRLRKLEARRGVTDLGGRVRGTADTTVGVFPSDASVVTYTPADDANWNGGADPGNTDDALDQLADRVDALESGNAKGSDLASASTLEITPGANYFHVTGTTTIDAIAVADPYPSAVLSDAPNAYWRMNTPSGDINDISGHGNSGTANGSLTYAQTGAITGVADDAIALDGSSAYFSVADAASLDLGDTLTLEAWVKKAANGVNLTIFNKDANAYLLRFDSSNRLAFGKENIAIIVVSTTTITDTNWHHVVATKSGATVHLYIDGADVTGTVTNQTLSDTGSPLLLGRRQTAAFDYFNGSLDELAVYPTALSSARVSAHYAAATATGSTPVVAGARLLLEFDGALTLTNSSVLILKGGIDYTTVAGDVFEFVYEGGGVWREVNRNV